jgi:hypothetical protein
MRLASLQIAIAIICASVFTGCANKSSNREQAVRPTKTESPGLTQTQETSRFEFNYEQADVVVDPATKIIEKEFKEENAELKYRNNVSFPQFDGSINATQKKFNNAVCRIAKKEFESYRRSQLVPRSNRFPRYHEAVEEFLQVAYDLQYVTDQFVNVRFYASTYGRGAAHAVDYFFVFNFDLENGRELRLQDIFTPSNRYLDFVANYSKEVVKERICREYAHNQPFEDCLRTYPLWEEGIKPSYKNYKAWNITKDGLLFSFDPCQLTGCAGGEFYVLVPYSELKSFIKPNSAVSKLVG